MTRSSLLQTDPRDEPPESAADALFRTRPNRPLLMVIDDQPCNLNLLSDIFKCEYDLFLAESGPQALAACQLRPPDLILLDVMMPAMSGHAVCQALKADPLTRHIPIIFITAANQDSAAEALALDLGAVDFILKPFHLRVVRARVRAHLAAKYEADAMRALALVDGLTGAGNRRQFDFVLEAEWRRAIRSGQTLALIMIDVDCFKTYNDRHGHPAGDACLHAVAGVVQRAVTRSHDLVARYGGEEFVCVLPDTTLAGAESKANELQRAVRALAIEHGASEVCGVVTISLGVATATPNRTDLPAALVTCADGQLYLAKRSGRGRVKAQELPLPRVHAVHAA